MYSSWSYDASKEANFKQTSLGVWLLSFTVLIRYIIEEPESGHIATRLEHNKLIGVFLSPICEVGKTNVPIWENYIKKGESTNTRKTT